MTGLFWFSLKILLFAYTENTDNSEKSIQTEHISVVGFQMYCNENQSENRITRANLIILLCMNTLTTTFSMCILPLTPRQFLLSSDFVVFSFPECAS
jgi:hypothetical protein